MSKITLNHMFTSASGKLCKKESTYVAYNKKTGKMYSAEYHEREQPNSKEQQAVKTLFTQKAQAASAWWTANKPSDTNPDGTEDYQKLMTKYNAQKKYGNPYSYLRSLVNDDLTITIGTTATSSSENAGGTTGGTGGTDLDA